MRVWVLLALMLSQWGCARRPALQVPAPSTAAVQSLRAELDGIFADPTLRRAQIGAKVYSLNRSETIYELNPDRLYIPASVNKVLTAAAALIRLGPDYRFKTELLAEGRIENGVLEGNLVAVGSGDPTFSARYQGGDSLAAFRDWAAQLKEKGVQKITGAILGSSPGFTGPGLGFGWEWNDLVHAYAAPVAGLQFNDNALTLEISPGDGQGNPALIRTLPLQGYLQIHNNVKTGAEGTPPEIRVEPGAGTEEVRVYGTIPAAGIPFKQDLAVRRPVHYFLSALRQVLSNEGIQTAGCGIDETSAENPRGMRVLASRLSPPLASILKPLLKDSLNLQSESLVRALGLAIHGEGTFAAGKAVVEEMLQQMGMPAESYAYADGSGLSRLNLQSAEGIIRVLRFMRQDPGYPHFHDALSIAGVDGTLKSRLKDMAARGSVRAKTGSMTGVSAIAGYLETADGELLAFAIMMNNFIGLRSNADSVQDKAIGVLSGFTRKLP